MRSRSIRVLDAPAASDVPPTPEAFLAALGGPACIRLAGRDRSRTRAVSTLLHGNEPSGVRAIHTLLSRGLSPAVDTILLIASVEAALAEPGFAHRALPGRRDLNRCFAPPFEDAEGRLARALLEVLRGDPAEALVDLHNTTGHTPHYGVGPDRTERQLALTSLFAARYVHSDIYLGTLVEAMHESTPSVTIECGLAGDPEADRTALLGLEEYLQADRLPVRPACAVQLLERPVRVCAREGTRLGYGESPMRGCDLTVVSAIDRHNFEPLPPGTTIGWVHTRDRWPIETVGARPGDVSRELFTLRGDAIETRVEIVPVMITTDPEIAIGDCLFYAMEPAGTAPTA
jgi:hypothetical protein